jgi:peptide/nickel transport system permease protein
MTGFLLRRALGGLVVLWLVSSAVFVLVHVAAADPARVIGGPQADTATLALIRHDLGLDAPLVVRYGTHLGRLARGDLGHSYVNGFPVTGLIAAALPATAVLVLGGTLLWLAGGLAAGVLAATRPWLDKAVTFLVLLGMSVPAFVLGIVLLAVCFGRLGLVEPGPPLQEHFWRRILLPWLTLALLQLAVYARLTRGALRDVLAEDYVQAARAKGLPEGRVVRRHGLRAALVPVAGQLGVDVGTLLGGAVVTEQVFGLQGVGQLLVRSVTVGDAPVILGVVLLTACCVVAAGLLTDLAYALLDPRVRLGRDSAVR